MEMSNECGTGCQCDTCRPVRDLIDRLGDECHGERVSTILLAFSTLLADISINTGIPKHEFAAQVYQAVSEMIDEINEANKTDEGEDNGHSTLQ